MDDNLLIKKYLQQCKADGVNQRTQKNVKNCLSLFFKWKGKRTISKSTILDYLDYLDEHEFIKAGKKRSLILQNTSTDQF